MTDVAASRQRNAGPLATPEQRPQDADAGPHPADQLVVGDTGVIAMGFQFDAAGTILHDGHPQRFEDSTERGYVHEIGDVVKNDRAVGGEGRRHDRQCRILGPADRKRSPQGHSPANHQHVHPWTSTACGRSRRVRFDSLRLRPPSPLWKNPSPHQRQTRARAFNDSLLATDAQPAAASSSESLSSSTPSGRGRSSSAFVCTKPRR